MKCFNHSDSDANGSCQGCGKGLCGLCVSRFENPLCEPCLTKNNSGVAKQLYLGLAITAAIFISVSVFLFPMASEHGNPGQAFFMGALMAGTYWGWKFLTDYFPSLTAGTSSVWLIYLLLKFVGAYFIGLIVGPYQIYKMVKEINKINKVKSQLSQGKI